MGTLAVHVFDYQQQPVEGKRVHFDFIGRVLGMFDSHVEEYTDDEGIAEFHDVPVGTVEL